MEGRASDRLDAPDREVLQEAAASLLSTADGVSGEVSAAILARQPDLVRTEDPEALAAVHRASQANVGAILSTLAGGVRPDALDVPDGALDLLDHLAVEVEALPVMLRAYRLGAAAFEQRWLAHLSEHAGGGERYERLARYSLAHVASYVDRISEVIVSRWTALTEEAARSGRRRDAAVIGLLDGREADQSAIDHPLGGGQLVVGVRAPNGAATDFSTAVQSMLGCHGQVARLSVGVAADVTLHWLSLAHPVTAEAVARTVEAGPSAGWVVVATAPPGLPALLASGRDVRRALEVLPRARADGAAVAYADVALLCTLLADEHASRRAARAILGPLAEPSPSAQRLRDTLRAYFNAGERKTGAAAVLGIHVKTVSHRLRQVEELLGPGFYSQATDLDVALLIEQSIGLDTP